MLKQDLSLKNIIYKSKYSFRLKNPDELKKKLNLLKLNSNQIDSLIDRKSTRLNSSH